MVLIGVVSRRRKYPHDAVPTLGHIAAAFVRALLPLLTPAIIIGGIVGGWFSPTEAAIGASAYAIVLSMVVYREIGPRKLYRVVLETIRTTAMVCFIVATAGIFAWVLAAHEAPKNISLWLLSLTENPLVLLLIINAFLFVAGFFVEGLAIMILAVPALAPTVAAVGIDPVHFGVVFIFNLMIGLMTPPMGIGLFVVSGVSGIGFNRLARATVPFLLPLVVVLLLLIVFPALVTFLPNALLGASS